MYTDCARCVRNVTIEVGSDGVRRERDLLTRHGRKEWSRRVDSARKRLDESSRKEAADRAHKLAWYRKNLTTRIDEIRNMHDGWDTGYGDEGKAASAFALSWVKRWVDESSDEDLIFWTMHLCHSGVIVLGRSKDLDEEGPYFTIRVEIGDGTMRFKRTLSKMFTDLWEGGCLIDLKTGNVISSQSRYNT